MPDDLNAPQNTQTTTPAGTTPGGVDLSSSKIVAKYGGDPAKLDAGVFELQNHASKTTKERDALAIENARLKAAVAGFTGNGGAPTEPTSATAKLASELVIDPNLLKGALAEMFVEALGPVGEIQKAQGDYTATNPDFSERSSKVDAFIRANPEVEARFQRLQKGDPLGAIEWVDSAYLKHAATTETAELPEEVRTARGSAGARTTMEPAERSPQGQGADAKLSDAHKKFVESEGSNKEEFRALYLDRTSGKQEFMRQFNAAMGLSG